MFIFFFFFLGRLGMGNGSFLFFLVRIGFVGSFSAPTLHYLVHFFCLTRVKQEKVSNEANGDNPLAVKVVLPIEGFQAKFEQNIDPH